MALTIINNQGGVSRQSGIELLRMLAMFMVLLLHANYIAFGSPSAEEVHNQSFLSFGRVLAEQLCIVAVNVYVLISGWFGIKLKLKGLVNLLLQVFTYSAVIFITYVILQHPELHLRDFKGLLIVGLNYWFVVSYILLYLISPVLNSFAETATKRQFELVLLCFYGFEFLYSWIGWSGGFSGGYSTIAFIGLYLLARYLKLYGGRLTSKSCGFYLTVYFLMSLAVALWEFIQLRLWGTVWLVSYLSYDCPFVVIASVLLFLAFTRLDFKNVIINYCATSSLSIYLIHVNPYLWDKYKELIREIYGFGGGLLGVASILFALLAFYLVCIVVDKVRIWLTPSDIICSAARAALVRMKVLR